MAVQIKIVVQSHLSDAEHELGFIPELAAERIKFVKYLIHTYKMDDEISDETLNDLWKNIIKK